MYLLAWSCKQRSQYVCAGALSIVVPGKKKSKDHFTDRMDDSVADDDVLCALV